MAMKQVFLVFGVLSVLLQNSHGTKRYRYVQTRPNNRFAGGHGNSFGDMGGAEMGSYGGGEAEPIQARFNMYDAHARSFYMPASPKSKNGRTKKFPLPQNNYMNSAKPAQRANLPGKRQNVRFPPQIRYDYGGQYNNNYGMAPRMINYGEGMEESGAEARMYGSSMYNQGGGMEGRSLASYPTTVQPYKTNHAHYSGVSMRSLPTFPSTYQTQTYQTNPGYAQQYNAVAARSFTPTTSQAYYRSYQPPYQSPSYDYSRANGMSYRYLSGGDPSGGYGSSDVGGGGYGGYEQGGMQQDMSARFQQGAGEQQQYGGYEQGGMQQGVSARYQEGAGEQQPQYDWGAQQRSFDGGMGGESGQQEMGAGGGEMGGAADLAQGRMGEDSTGAHGAPGMEYGAAGSENGEMQYRHLGASSPKPRFWGGVIGGPHVALPVIPRVPLVGSLFARPLLARPVLGGLPIVRPPIVRPVIGGYPFAPPPFAGPLFGGPVIGRPAIVSPAFPALPVVARPALVGAVGLAIRKKRQTNIDKIMRNVAALKNQQELYRHYAFLKTNLKKPLCNLFDGVSPSISAKRRYQHGRYVKRIACGQPKPKCCMCCRFQPVKYQRCFRCQMNAQRFFLTSYDTFPRYY